MALPTSAEPLRLADGTLIAPSGRVVKKSVSPSEMIEVPSNTVAQRMVAASRRKLADLPALPTQMNVISVVLMYTMFGVNDDEIAIATGMSVDQVTSLKSHDVYSRVQEEVAKNIIVQDQSEIARLLQECT
jgi:ABC-type proline/glycine betaine transport system ATPase subunit